MATTYTVTLTEEQASTVRTALNRLNSDHLDRWTTHPDPAARKAHLERSNFIEALLKQLREQCA